MKKKIIFFIVSIMLLVPCLCINVFAQNNDITILNGGQNLQYKGNTYMRFDASAVYFEAEEYLENVKYDVIEIKSADYDISKNAVMITAYFNYRDGSTLTASFIDQNHYGEYLSLTENANDYAIEFFYPNQTTINTTKAALCGQKVMLTQQDLMLCDNFSVDAQSANQIYSITTGSLLIVNDDYYYVNFKESDITDPYEFYPNDMQSLNAYKITDPELCEQIKSAYGNGGIIDLFSSNFFGGVSTAFVMIIFAIIPIAALILFIILYNRTKSNTYKKIFLSICVAATIELLVFIVTAVLLVAFK